MQTNIEEIQKETYKRGRQEARAEVAMLWWKAGAMTYRIVQKYQLNEEEQELFYTAIRREVAKRGYRNWAESDRVFAFKRMVCRGYSLEKIGYYLGVSCEEVDRLWEMYKDDCQDGAKTPSWHVQF